MAVNWIINKGLAGTQQWSLFALLMALACIAHAAVHLPITISIYFPNIIFGVGLFLLVRGCDAFFEVKSITWPWYLIVSLGGSVFTYFLYVDFNFIARVIVNYSIWSLAMLMCLRALYLGKDRNTKRFSAAHWAFALSCISLLSVFTFRLFMLGSYAVDDSLVSMHWVNLFFSISLIIMPLLLCFSLCLLCSCRKEQELLGLKQQAEQSSQIKGRYLTLLSHELRTPLNAIVGNAESLKRIPREPAKHGQLCDVIVNAAMSLANLANQVLLQAKGEHCVQTPSRISISQHTQELIRLMQPLAQAKALDLRLSLKGIAPDEQHLLEQDTLSLVLRNLLSNAIKYTDKGGVTLSAEVIAQQGDQQQLRFAVTDTGRGLTGAQKEAIFQPFMSFSDDDSIAKSGGMGLALCKQLLDDVGSELKIDSELDKGTCFSFVMSAKKCQKVVFTSPKRMIELPLTVLVVEDNQMNLEVISGYLEDMTLDHLVAQSLSEAEQCLSSQHIDVILLDMNLPDGNGLTWYREKLPNLTLNRIPSVIALTGDADPQLKEQCINVGMFACLTKPITAEQLYSIIEKTPMHQAEVITEMDLVNESIYLDYQRHNELQTINTKLMNLSDHFDYELAQIKGLVALSVIPLAQDKLEYLVEEAHRMGMTMLYTKLQQTKKRIAQQPENVEWEQVSALARRSVEKARELSDSNSRQAAIKALDSETS
ncbi:ATP-binding protein [Pseudoalteromonas sp. T1lg65]|uniref:ATP-binding protein n=1 Tax=Pseudoalteromonas sp. T1lg65 TaxID=2077101 RepID=UPI003F79A5C2